MPIALCIGRTPLGYFLLFSDKRFLYLLPQTMFSGMDSFVLMAIPFFMLAGELMNASGITDRIMNFAEKISGNIRGALAYANIIASFFFAGITGAAVSDVAALGSIEIPAMVKQGYDKPFSAAVTAASSLVGPIIPPSITMVVYGSIMGVSIAGLFAAGFLPGILFCLVDFIYVYYISKKRNYPKSEERRTLKGVVNSAKGAAFALATPIIIIGGILGGIFTPTEAAGVAVFYAFALERLIYKKLDIKDYKKLLLASAVTCSKIFLIIAVAYTFKWILATLNVPAMIINFMMGISDNKWVAITLVNVILIFVGMFFETGAANILFAPIFGPVMVALGFDPLHFGIVFIINLCIGLATPPLGLCLYGACSISGVNLEEISREIFPFIILNIGVLCIITYFPALTLWFPRMLGY
ncbi:Sialic acid TRAP transporter large permease protein SiaM [subsurface metagenome]